MAEKTDRVFNEFVREGQIIRRYPSQAKDGTYNLSRSVGLKSNLREHSFHVVGLERAIELLTTGKFKIRVSSEGGTHPALLVFDSISIPELGHVQRKHYPKKGSSRFRFERIGNDTEI